MAKGAQCRTSESGAPVDSGGTNVVAIERAGKTSIGIVARNALFREGLSLLVSVHRSLQVEWMAAGWDQVPGLSTVPLVLCTEAPAATQFPWLLACESDSSNGEELRSSIFRRLGMSNRIANRPTLTAKETELLALLCRGLDRRQIAATLVVSENTVKTHLSSLYRKLGVTGRATAILAARPALA